MSSPLLALLLRAATTRTVTYGFLLVGVGVAIIFASSVFTVPLNQSAYGGTFPGQNGLIAFTTFRHSVGYQANYEIYVMDADGSGQTRLTNNTKADLDPSWSPDGEKIAFGSSSDGVDSML